MVVTKATNCYGLRALIRQTISDWLDLREQNLKKLVYASDDETKLKYLAQIDFIEVVRANIEAIVNKSKEAQRDERCIH